MGELKMCYFLHYAGLKNIVRSHGENLRSTDFSLKRVNTHSVKGSKRALRTSTALVHSHPPFHCWY